ncbi:MAG: HEAT repeat domain-containing protein [Planctomycetaceae bacterium]
MAAVSVCLVTVAPACSDDLTLKRVTVAPADEPEYDGLTLSEWRELMKSLDFQSPAAAKAVPGLLMLLQDCDLPWFTRKQAALTLGRIGQPAESAVTVLRSLLMSDDPVEREAIAPWAAKALALFGPLAAEATPELELVLTDVSRPQIDRLCCVEALGRIGGARAEAVAALINFIQADIGHTHEAHELQCAAVDGLALVGPQAAPAVPILIRLTSDDSESLRKNSAVALGAIGPPSSIAAEALAELVLFDELPEVREAAATSLASIGDQGVEALHQLLTDQDMTVRRLAAESLGKVIRPNQTTTDALLVALLDTDPVVRIAAAESLWRTNRKGERILSTILDALTSEDRQIRIRAYRLLLDLGSQAEPVIPMLKRLTRHGGEMFDRRNKGSRQTSLRLHRRLKFD